MLPWHWFSSKSSTSQVEPAVVASTAEESIPTTDTTTPNAINTADSEPTSEANETSDDSEETETTSTPLTLEEQLAAAKARMKRSSMVAEASPSDLERPRASTSGQRLKRLTSSSSPSPDKESASKRRHSKQISTDARPGAPRRSSSVKNVFNAYYKIFGGKPPSKPPAAEQPVEEAERLRKVVRRYEKQLEEASNTIMLQDKVLAKWESKVKGIKSDDNVPESSSRGLDSLEGTHFESSGSDPVNRLTKIQESSREMLADFAMIEEGKQAQSPTQGNPSTIAEVLRLTKELQTAQADVERLTKELQAAQATVEEHTIKHTELEQQNSQSLEAANQSRSELEEAKAAHSETLTFLETVKRTLSETQASHLDTASTLRSTQALLSEKTQLVALHETTLSDKDAERDALLAGHEAALSQINQDLETDREKIAYLETQVGTISKEYQDAKTALDAARDDLETAKSGVSNVTIERDAAKAQFEKISADYEAKTKEHQDISSALDAARSEIDEHKTIAETAKTETATIQEQLTRFQKELEDTKLSHDSANTRIAELLAAAELHGSTKEDAEKANAEVEKLKQEIEGHVTSQAQYEEQLRSVQAQVDQHVASKAELQKELDDHLNSKAALQTEVEDHIASKNELQKQLEDHVNSKSVLQKELDDHTTSKASLQQELEIHVNSLSALQKQLDDHATAKIDLEKQVEHLSVVQADLEAAQAKISELQTGSEDQVRALQADLDAHVKSKADLQAELEQLSTLKAEHENALAKVAELEAKSTDNQTQLEAAHARIADLTKDADSHAALQSEHTSTLSQLAETKQQADLHAARIDELNKGIEGQAAVKADLESAHTRVAELEEAVKAHDLVKAELEEHREKVTVLSKAAEDHETTRAELQLHKEQVAKLSEAAKEHEATKAELESHREQVATLSKAVKDNEAVKSELESHREQVATLSKAVDEHEPVKRELASHREQVAALSKAAEEHDAVKAELESHREQVATLSKAVEEHGTVSKELESHREQVATLSKAAEEHATVKADLESHQEKVASLSKALEEHDAVKAELESHKEKVATLSNTVEEHAAVKADLASHQQQVSDLSKALEEHSAVKAELESHKEKVTTLSKTIEDHAVVKADLETHQQRVVELTKAVEDHEIVKTELGAAHTRLADLEKDIETHKADKGSISEQLAAAQAALASATESHGELSSKAKDAEERLLVAEQALQSTKEDHEANLAALAGKVTVLEQLQEHNALLQQELKASLDSERALKLAVQDLEGKLNAVKSKSVDKELPKQGSEPEKSDLAEAAAGAAAIGMAGAGALGLAKVLSDDDKVEAAKIVEEEKPEEISKVIEEKKPEVIAEKEPEVAEEEKSKVVEEEKAVPVVNEEAPLPVATTDATEAEAIVNKEQQENSLLAEESQEQLDAIVSASTDVEESKVSEEFKDLPAADKAMRNLAQSQDTLPIDEEDLEIPQVKQKSVADPEIVPSSASEGAEELENTLSSKESLVESQETDPTTTTAPLIKESGSDLAPETHTEQQGNSNVEVQSYLPEAAVAAGAIGLGGVGALGLAKAINDDSEDESLATDSFDKAEVHDVTANKNPEAWWASSKDASKDLVDPVQETEPEAKQEFSSTASLKEEHTIESQAFGEHEDIKADLPATKEILTEEAEVDSPETAVGDLPLVQGPDSVDDTENGVVNEEETLASKELLGEEEPKTTAVHHSLHLDLEPVTLDDLEFKTADFQPTESQAPYSPMSSISTRSKRKSVRWEDIESAKSSPMEERHESSAGLGAAWLLNGEKDGVLSAEPADDMTKDEPQVIAQEISQPTTAAAEDAGPRQVQPELPVDLPAEVEFVDSDSVPQEAAEPTDALNKGFVEQDDAKPSTFSPEITNSDESEPETTSNDVDEFASTLARETTNSDKSEPEITGNDVDEYASILQYFNASEPEPAQQEAATSTVDDNKLHGRPKDDSEYPLQSAGLSIAISTNAPEIPERSPDRLITTPERSPDRLTARLDHDQSSVEELVHDNVLDEPQEVSAKSDDSEIEYLASVGPVSKYDESDDEDSGVYVKPSSEFSDKFDEHSTASEIQAAFPEPSLSESDDGKETEKTTEVVASKEEKLNEEEVDEEKSAVPEPSLSESDDAKETEKTSEVIASKKEKLDEREDDDEKLEFLPITESVSELDETSNEKSGVHKEFSTEFNEVANERSTTSDVQAAVPGLFLNHSEDGEETEKTDELVASKDQQLDEDNLKGEVDKEYEVVQQLPLLFVEKATKSDRKDENSAKSQDEELKKSVTKETPSEPAPTTIAETTKGNAKNDAVSDDKDDNEHAKEEIRSDTPITATKIDTFTSLKQKTEEEPIIDHNDGEKPITESITTSTKDEEPITDVTDDETPLADDEIPIATEEKKSTKKAKKAKKGGKGKKELLTEEEDESSTLLAEKAAHLLENIKEAI